MPELSKHEKSSSASFMACIEGERVGISERESRCGNRV